MKKLLCALSLLLATQAHAQWADDQPMPADNGSSANSYTANIEVSPLGLFIGAISGQVLFPVSEQFAIGPTFSYINLDILDITVKGNSIGFRGDYAFGGMIFEDGWYGTGAISMASFELDAEDKVTGETASAKIENAISFGVGAGYHWFWETFNLRLGASLNSSSEQEVTVEYSDGETETIDAPGVGVGFEFLIGFRF